jgi:serine/threonine-protein kinase HipA
MRSALVYYKELLAGTLTESHGGEFIFQYEEGYVINHPDSFLTFSLPVRKEPFVDRRLFPFFEGLIPEGWLLDIASKNWKINGNDRMGLLLACCRNCIGAVSIKPIEEEDEG